MDMMSLPCPICSATDASPLASASCLAVSTSFDVFHRMSEKCFSRVTCSSGVTATSSRRAHVGPSFTAHGMSWRMSAVRTRTGLAGCVSFCRRTR